MLDVSIRFYQSADMSKLTKSMTEERAIIPNPIPVRTFRDNQNELENIHKRTHISMTALTRMAIDLGLPLLKHKLEANGEHPTNGRRAV